MRLTDKEKAIIVFLKNAGYSSREIASMCGVGKTTVNDIVAKNEFSSGPRIKVLDIETSAAIVACFQRYDINLTENHIIKEGGRILCASVKNLGQSEIRCHYALPEEIKANTDDSVVIELYKELQDVDVVVIHNGKKFDKKMIQTRGLALGLGMLPNFVVIDTLEIAKRKLRLPSNKLDSIGSYFNLGRKVVNTGIDLWIRVQQGDQDAMQEMMDYCDGDVLLLEDVFLMLMGLGAIGFNAANYYHDELSRCPACGSPDVESQDGFAYSGVSKYNVYKCNHCGYHSRDRANLNSTSKRKSMLV